MDTAHEVKAGNGLTGRAAQAAAAQANQGVKRQVQLYLPTIELMGLLKEKTGLTTDEVIYTALLKLEAGLGEHREETKEQKLRRLAGLGDA